MKVINFRDTEIMGEISLIGFYYAGHLCPPFNKKIRRDIFLLSIIIY
jgi:hypothetical protein